MTAVGHSTFLSGATPSVSGIIGNEWYERTPFIIEEICKKDTKGNVASVADASTCLTGPSERVQGSSPRRLLVSTLGDELKMARPTSKVFGLSLKDRGAILTSGHMGNAAYCFYEDRAVTSTYYMSEWIVAFNAGLQNRIELYKWYPVERRNEKPFCAMAVLDGVRKCGFPLENKKVEDKPKLENTRWRMNSSRNWRNKLSNVRALDCATPQTS